MSAWREKCGRCGCVAPPAVVGPEGQAAQGWVTYEGEEVFVISAPEAAGLLPKEVVEAIRELDQHVLVGLVPDPHVEVAELVGFNDSLLGLVCPDCQRETGWDYLQWSLFFTRRGDEPDAIQTHDR